MIQFLYDRAIVDFVWLSFVYIRVAGSNQKLKGSLCQRLTYWTNMLSFDSNENYSIANKTQIIVTWNRHTKLKNTNIIIINEGVLLCSLSLSFSQLSPHTLN